MLQCSFAKSAISTPMRHSATLRSPPREQVEAIMVDPTSHADISSALMAVQQIFERTAKTAEYMRRLLAKATAAAQPRTPDPRGARAPPSSPLNPRRRRTEARARARARPIRRTTRQWRQVRGDEGISALGDALCERGVRPPHQRARIDPAPGGGISVYPYSANFPNFSAKRMFARMF